MSTRTLEELNKLVDKQQKVIQMLQDVHEIQNLMGKYVYWHEVERDPEFPDTIYAMKTPGVSAEVAGMGAYVGTESIHRFFKPMPGMEPGAKTSRKGVLFTHPLATPVIEVAGDGKTAKGVWMSPGYEGGVKDIGGCFVYTKYGVDFAKENGKWKVWHYHVYRVFMTPWNTPYKMNGKRTLETNKRDLKVCPVWQSRICLPRTTIHMLPIPRGNWSPNHRNRMKPGKTLFLTGRRNSKLLSVKWASSPAGN